MEELAEHAGLSKSQISRIETDERDPSVESLKAVADALGVSIAQLLETSDAWQQAPIFGTIGEGGMLQACEHAEVQYLTVPAAYGELLVLRVGSDSLYPRYNKGEHVLCAKDTVDPKGVLGRECLVHLANGRAMLRMVHAGSKPNTYNLTSHNQPPLNDVAVVSCRPVVRF